MWIKQTTFNINISSEDIALIFLKMCVTDDGFKDRPHSGKLFSVNFKFEISYQCNQLSLNSGLVQNSEITIFKRFFWCAPFLVFVEFIKTLLLLFYVFFFFWPWGMWDLGSPTRDWTLSPCIGRWSFTHWITSEVLEITIFRVFLCLVQGNIYSLDLFFKGLKGVFFATFFYKTSVVK